MPCNCSPKNYFYSVYTNKRICRTHWTDEPDEILIVIPEGSQEFQGV